MQNEKLFGSLAFGDPFKWETLEWKKISSTHANIVGTSATKHFHRSMPVFIEESPPEPLEHPKRKQKAATNAKN